MVVARLLFVVRGIKSTQKNTTNSAPSRPKDKEFNHKREVGRKMETKAKENQQANSKLSYKNCFDTPR